MRGRRACRRAIDACQATSGRGGGGGGGRADAPVDRWATRSIAARTAAGRGRSCTATTSTSPARRRRTRSTRSGPTPPTRSQIVVDQRFDVRVARRRQDLELRLLPRRVRRLPVDLVGRAGPAAHHARQRRRRERLVRRRPHRRLLPEQADRRGLRGRRRHGRSLQRLRRPAGSRVVEGPEQLPERHDHARGLDDGRHRRRHVQPGRSDRLALGLQQLPDRRPAALRSADGAGDEHPAAAAAERSGAALQLDHADRAVAAQPADRLHRRAGALPLAQPRRRVAGDQSRSHDRRRDEVRAQLGLRALLHDHLDLGIAADRRRHLGRHRRRQGAGDA